jgi:lantibiotic modifying enzyme
MKDSLATGMAHGHASILQICKLCISIKKSEYLATYLANICVRALEFSLNWKAIGGLYPHLVRPKLIDISIPNFSRLAWCWGDLGIAVAFHNIKSSPSFQVNNEKALKVINYCAKRRNLNDEKVVDAGLCHGSSGIALVFDHFYHETGSSLILATRNFWLQKTLEMCIHEDSASGFKAFDSESNSFYVNSNFLEGDAGIGLMLLDFMTGNRGNWRKSLLVY